MSFSKNVFINCPFDKEYLKLARPLIFTLLCHKLVPRFSTSKSSGSQRVEEIKKLIETSKFSIHDFSRSDPLPYLIPRFNMPFEAGLDIGCQTFGSSQQRQKICLILDMDPYRYKVVLSDISGQDIKCHNNAPQTVIEKVREWLVDNTFSIHPGADLIWKGYLICYSDIKVNFRKNGWKKSSIEKMAFTEFIALCKEWLDTDKAKTLFLPRR